MERSKGWHKHLSSSECFRVLKPAKLRALMFFIVRKPLWQKRRRGKMPEQQTSYPIGEMFKNHVLAFEVVSGYFFDFLRPS